MHKLFLFLTFVSFSSLSLEARLVDGIALIVEGEAITTAEIRAVRSQMRVSKDKAIDLLIQDRLQTTAMKEIQVSEDEIDVKIEQIAKENKLTLPKMQKILKKQGTSWVKYREGIRDSLKKSHFYQDVVVASIPEPTEDELKLFYNKHKRSFTIPSRISMIEYSTPSKKALNTFIKSGKKVAISSKRVTRKSSKLEIDILTMLLQTAKNKYTKILNAGDKYISYKVLSKKGQMIMPFNVAQGAIISKWKQEQQGKMLKDYFKKLRTSAEIQILR